MLVSTDGRIPACINTDEKLCSINRGRLRHGSQRKCLLSIVHMKEFGNLLSNLNGIGLPAHSKYLMASPQESQGVTGY